MDIKQFAEEVGETPRQIRYLIAGEFIPSPTGSRFRADYGAEHVAAVRRYQYLRSLDLKPSNIKALLLAERPGLDGCRFMLAPGLFLLVDPAVLDARQLSTGDVSGRVAAVLAQFLPSDEKETSDAP